VNVWLFSCEVALELFFLDLLKVSFCCWLFYFFGLSLRWLLWQYWGRGFGELCKNIGWVILETPSVLSFRGIFAHE
jgi:hypothetical protein